MESIANRVQSLMEDKGLTAYQLSKKGNISAATLSRLLKQNSKPNSETISKICNYFEISEAWLLSGNGDKYIDASKLIVNDAYSIDVHTNSNANQFIKLPNGQYLMTMPLAEFSIQAGLLDHYQDLEFLADMQQHSIIVEKPVKGRYIAFRVKGDSMEDGSNESISQNSIVSTRELNRQYWLSKLRTKDFPYWVIYTSQSKYPLLKEITNHDVENGIITCHSLNDSPEYGDFPLSINDIQALFYVIDVSKTISRKLTY